MGSRVGGRVMSGCGCSSKLHLSSGPLLLLSLVLPATSFAQLIASSVGAVTTSSFIPTTSRISTTFTTITLGSLTTSAIRHATTTASLSSNTTSTSAVGSTAYSVGSDGSDGSDDDPPLDRSTSVLNYYFVFLALLGIILFVAIYSLHRRKKRLKAQYRNSGQNALARDLDGWVAGRRWINGNWRTGYGDAAERREEGLNEFGEAPPPYKAGPETRGGGLHGEDEASPGSSLTVPLQTLSREGRATLKPPGYAETIRSESVGSVSPARQEGSRPATAGLSVSTDISRPPTAALSTRDLL